MSDPKGKTPKQNFYPPWAPRFWNGMQVSDYLSLLNENRYQIHLQKWPMAALVGACSLANSTLGLTQRVLYSKKIAQTELREPPIFVIGHWRSGTTLMHELLARDRRFAFPNNFDAFVPGHLLVSRYFLYPFVKLIMPSKRPMDNMRLDVASPQEDDFALCTMGAPTAYRRIAFANRPNRDHLSLDLNAADPDEKEKLKRAMLQFLKVLNVRYGKRLVLKSPPHTGRVRQLMEWFPGAKFVHMARTPYKLVPSTMRLWRLLDSIQGFQIPRYNDTWLKNYVFECKDLMYQSYLDVREEIPEDQLVEVAFESLVKDPIAEMARVYRKLNLEDFDSARGAIESYFESRKGHKTNPFSIDDSLKTDIDANWKQYMDAFGYSDTSPDR